MSNIRRVRFDIYDHEVDTILEQMKQSFDVVRYGKSKNYRKNKDMIRLYIYIKVKE